MKNIISAIVMTLTFVFFKYFNGIENTLLLILSLVLLELWKLNSKK